MINYKRATISLLVLFSLVASISFMLGAASQTEVASNEATTAGPAVPTVTVAIFNVVEGDDQKLVLQHLDYTWSGQELIVVQDGDLCLVERKESTELMQFSVQAGEPTLKSVKIAPPNLYSARTVKLSTCLIFGAPSTLRAPEPASN